MDAKKLLVLSDTHGCLPALRAVLNWAKDFLPPNDAICAAAFLGDGVSDLGRTVEASGFYGEWKMVRGNNDYEPTIPETTVYNFADHRFYMCHGHRHGLYGNYQSLVAAGRNNEADVILFGHAHVPFFKNINGILLINPGSVGRPRSKLGASFAVVECADGKVPEVQFWSVADNGKIEKLSLPNNRQ
jgi:putative phosphoesterase